MLLLEWVLFRPLFGGFWVSGEKLVVCSFFFGSFGRRRVFGDALRWVLDWEADIDCAGGSFAEAAGNRDLNSEDGY